jgi:pimeloyl-ACP methyl ester carboxylesterase
VAPHVLSETGKGLFGGEEAPVYRTVSEKYLQGRSCPVLAIYAGSERAVIEETILNDPRSRTIAWEGAGHWLHQERPDEFNNIVENWIASLDSPSPV